MNKTVKIGPTQTLFDLNGQTTNFNIDFSIKSSIPNTDFYCVVVDQSSLDNGEYNFQQSNAGEIGGNIVYDKNIYQNFVICLKSNHPEHEVTIMLDKSEIPPSSQQKPQPPQSNPPPPEKQEQQIKENYISTKESSKSSLFNWKIILIVVLVAGAIGYLWYSSKKDTTVSEKIEALVTSSPALSSNSSNFNSPASQDFSIGNRHVNPIDSNIMSKLNKLKFK
jgi:hypothetical protein|uniref:Uncharacterized protein n=1 Tax=viral metagenome TaxID=1070528 RepID=A0A6C0J3Z2_9ZZZZ